MEEDLNSSYRGEMMNFSNFSPVFKLCPKKLKNTAKKLKTGEINQEKYAIASKNFRAYGVK